MSVKGCIYGHRYEMNVHVTNPIFVSIFSFSLLSNKYNMLQARRSTVAAGCLEHSPCATVLMSNTTRHAETMLGR